ncbi:retrovirus-related pol polyprotein from transposon TNT 1-94 [Tanacetum coccineum]
MLALYQGPRPVTIVCIKASSMPWKRWSKENGVNILKSIDEGPFQMGTFWETLTEGTEGAPNLGPERPRVYSDLSPEDKERMQLNSMFVNNMLPEWQHEAHANREQNDVTIDYTAYGGSLTCFDVNVHTINTTHNIYDSPSTYVSTTTLLTALNLIWRTSSNHTKHTYLKQIINSELHQIQGTKLQSMMGELWFRMFRVDRIEAHIAMNCNQPKRPQNPILQRQKLLIQARENGVALDETSLFIGRARLCFMAILSSCKDPVMISGQLMINILSEEHERPDHYQMLVIVNDFNDHMFKDKKHPFTNNVSSVPNDAISMRIFNDMHEPHSQPVSVTTRNTVVDNSLTIELATYKEQVELYKRRVLHIVLWYLDSGCSKHMIGDRSRLRNFMNKFIGIVRFGNDHFGAIICYGDYVIDDTVISKHSCYVRDTDGVELIKGSRDSNLYTISVEDMMKSSPICLLSKASKNKSWLWHQHLNNLNFGTINDLARKDLVRGLPRLKFEKDHLCSACQLGKSKKNTHKPKTKNTNLEVLNTLHMDLCGTMRVQTINGKKYILVIVDDYSWFTWVMFLRSKDETPEVIIKFLTQIQVGLNKTVIYIRTDNDTEFVNKDLTDCYERVGIFHQKSIPRTPQKNDIVER